jgi:hypothetical protein
VNPLCMPKGICVEDGVDVGIGIGICGDAYPFRYVQWTDKRIMWVWNEKCGRSQELVEFFC